MAQLTRKVKIEWKINPTYFTKVNEKNMSFPIKRIGSTIPAVNRMLSNDEMMRAIMPNILGIDPSSVTSNWTKELAHYWHSLCVEVPEQGLILDASIRFSISDSNSVRSKHIKEFVKAHAIKDDVELMKTLTDSDSKLKVSEEELYKYAEPVVPSEYVLWFYCLGYRAVANSLDTINKSSKIEFFMYDEQIKRESRKKQSKEMINATQLYVELSKEPDTLRNVMIVVNPTQAKTYISSSEEDISIDAHEILMKNPSEFIKYAKDSNLKHRATIEKYIATGILRKIQETDTIVDSADVTKVIGTTMDEAVVFFTKDSPEHKKAISEFSYRFNELSKNTK